eukprot:TRINITY_DN13551_c0_g1_i1.p1 TRINITY_DN13551_c0_g1~~TRINITY_DN13551_c0_g1_i1.p1  ORF type:complete len:179 (+),score=82.62 TRINITY_DN13551_c0_g1_i1:78-614(+)
MQHANMLQHLAQDVWARVGPSKLHGVGVVAIRDIPKGTVVDKVPAGALPPALRQQVPSASVSLSELKESGADEHTVSYLREMYVCTDGKMDLPKYGANVFIGLAHFVNHAATPNCEFVDTQDKKDVGINMKIVATQDVKRGDELVADYSYYLSNEELQNLPGMQWLKSNIDGAPMDEE